MLGANKLVEAAKGPKPLIPSPMELGGKLANNIEDFNRITPYINLRRQGFSPEMAAKRVSELQINYSDLTHFEQKYAKNLIPFWTFSSRMLPLVATEIVTNPRGATAQMVKVGSKSDKSSNKPEWMKGETSIPFDGKHYGGLGLMHEDAIKLLGPLVKGDLPELARQGAVRLNPLLRFPIEQATGHDMRTGKDISKMHDVQDLTNVPIGTTGVLALRSSPVARYVTESKKLKQSRDRALQNLIGIKSSG